MTFSRSILYFHFFIALVLSVVSLGVAQNTGNSTVSSPPKGELLFLQMEVERDLVVDIDARLYNDKLYLASSQFFSHLQIKISSPASDRMRVFYPDPDNPVQLHFNKAEENAGYIQDEFDIYILKDRLEQLFAMQLIFDYRRLSIFLSTEEKLPVIAAHERKERYQHFIPQSVELIPEKKVQGGHHLLNGWVADWSLTNDLSPHSTNYSYNLGLGGQVLGGNLSLSGSGSKKYGLHSERFRGRWSMPVYSTPLLKQLQLGFLSHTNGAGLEHRAYRGFSLTNRPHAPRKDFNIFHHTGQLEQGLDAELYVNRRLRDFVVGNNGQAQDYRFSTPLQYGTNLIQLHYYDQNGLSHQKEHFIYVPHAFLPDGEFQYTLSGGRYENLDGINFGRLDMQLGVTPHLTAGGGALAEFSAGEKNLFPFVQSWMRMGNAVIAEGSHTYSRISEGSLRLMFSGSQSLLMEVKKYHHNPLEKQSSTDYRQSQGAGDFAGNNREPGSDQNAEFNSPSGNSISHFNKMGKSLEASLNTSFPVDYSFLDLSTFLSTRFTRYFSGNQNLSLYSGFSALLPFDLNARVNTRIMFANEQVQQMRPTQVDTEMQLSRRVFRKLLLRPRLSFNHRLQRLSSFGIQINARLTSRSTLNFSFDRDPLFNNNRFLVSFKLNLPFARHTSYLRSGAGTPSLQQTTTGSVAFNSNRNAFYFDDQNRVEKARLALDPFLDLNDNGQKDAGEPPVKGVTADVYRPGSHTPFYQGENIIENLVPYEEYFVKINGGEVSNPLWKIKHSSYSVQVLPNLFNTIPVPVIVTGEMAGRIELANTNTTSDSSAQAAASSASSGTTSLYGLEVQVRSLDGNGVPSADDITADSERTDNTGALSPSTTTVSTYTEGQFYYVGLMPGRYKAILNADQLAERNLTAVRDSLDFTIEAVQQGDIKDNLIFRVTASDSTNQHADTLATSTPGDYLNNRRYKQTKGAKILHHGDEQLQLKYPSSQSAGTYFAIQMGAFKHKENALAFSRSPEIQSHRDVTIIYDAEDHLYKCLVGKFFKKDMSWQALIILIQKNPHFYRNSFIVELPK